MNKEFFWGAFVLLLFISVIHAMLTLNGFFLLLVSPLLIPLVLWDLYIQRKNKESIAFWHKKLLGEKEVK